MDKQAIIERVEVMGQAERAHTFRAVRECIGWSQGDVATRFSVAVQSVKRWERGTIMVPDEVLVELLAVQGRMMDAIADKYCYGIPPVVCIWYPRTFDEWLEPRDGNLENEWTMRDWQQALAQARMEAAYVMAQGSIVRWV